MLQQDAQLYSCCDSRSYCVRRKLYWHIIKPVLVTSLRTAGTHDPISRVEFMKALKNLSIEAWPLSVTDQSSVVHEVSELQNVTRPAHAW